MTPQIACGRCGTINLASSPACANCGARLLPPTGTQAWERAADTRLAAWFVVGLMGVAAICVMALVFWLAGQPPPPCTDLACAPQPPIVPPLAAAAPYFSEQYEYSLDAAPLYSSCGRETERDIAGIKWTAALSSGGVTSWPIEVRGEDANGRSAERVVNDVAAGYAGATLVYVIPMVEMGSHPGYGAVYDLNVGAGNAGAVHARAIVMAAVDGNLGIVLDSLGPFHSGPYAHANPSKTRIAFCISPTLTSLTWPGEAPR